MKLAGPFLGFALTVVCVSPLGQATPLVGTEFDLLTPLYDVNQANGDLTVIGPTGNTNVGDLTSDTRSASGPVYGVRIDTNRLLDINPATGAINSSIAITGSLDVSGSPHSIISLAFNPVTGRLYGNTSLGFGAPADDLFEIDPATGVATRIGAIGFDNIYALAFSQAGVLYGISELPGLADPFFSINTTSGAGSLIATLTTTLNYDIASRPEDDVMFLADHGTSSLYTLNTTDGSVTLVGDYGSAANVAGLAFLGVPEASTWTAGGVLLLGLGATVLRRHRK